MGSGYVSSLTEEQLERLKHYHMHGKEYVEFFTDLIGCTAASAILCALCPPALPILIVGLVKEGGPVTLCKYFVAGDKIMHEEIKQGSKLEDIIGIKDENLILVKQ